MCVGLLSCASCIIFLSSRLSVYLEHTQLQIAKKCRDYGSLTLRKRMSVTFDIGTNFSPMGMKNRMRSEIFLPTLKSIISCGKSFCHCVNWLMHIWQESKVNSNKECSNDKSFQLKRASVEAVSSTFFFSPWTWNDFSLLVCRVHLIFLSPLSINHTCAN